MTTFAGFLKWLIGALLGGITFLAAFFVLTQDLQLFPGVISGLFTKPQREIPPADIQELLATTSDGERLTVWRLGAKIPSQKIAVMLHGNGDTLRGFYFTQQWIQSLGFTTYTFHYRGYGESTGFPSELGIYRDAEAVLELAALREEVPIENIMIFGQSVGTGPAAYLAQKYHAKALVLIAPYRSIPAVVRDIPYLKYLVSFVWYRFPTDEYLQKLKGTCIVIAHGRKDQTIPYINSEELARANKENNRLTFLSSDRAGHNDLLRYESKIIGESIVDCVNQQ